METQTNQQLETTEKKKSFYWGLEAEVFPVWRELCPNILDGGGEEFVCARARLKGTKRWEWIRDSVMDQSRFGYVGRKGSPAGMGLGGRGWKIPPGPRAAGKPSGIWGRGRFHALIPASSRFSQPKLPLPNLTSVPGVCQSWKSGRRSRSAEESLLQECGRGEGMVDVGNVLTPCHPEHPLFPPLFHLELGLDVPTQKSGTGELWDLSLGRFSFSETIPKQRFPRKRT